MKFQVCLKSDKNIRYLTLRCSYMVQQDGPHAYWMTKGTDTHTEYVMFIYFPR
jgi:hypothetical protein